MQSSNIHQHFSKLFDDGRVGFLVRELLSFLRIKICPQSFVELTEYFFIGRSLRCPNHVEVCPGKSWLDENDSMKHFGAGQGRWLRFRKPNLLARSSKTTVRKAPNPLPITGTNFMMVFGSPIHGFMILGLSSEEECTQIHLLVSRARILDSGIPMKVKEVSHNPKEVRLG